MGWNGESQEMALGLHLPEVQKMLSHSDENSRDPSSNSETLPCGPCGFGQSPMDVLFQWPGDPSNGVCYVIDDRKMYVKHFRYEV